ncbi:MAG: hypothetical protein IBX57_00785 [Gammaproteobacteria bacterium]|nr:hypothetical protein [Gammaproteobacteria bacterium]
MNLLKKYSGDIVVSNEDIDELEYEIYLKVSDFKQLKNAKYSEHQEQWQMRFNKGPLAVKVRSRKCIRDGDIKYYLTTKLDLEDVDAAWELEDEVTRLHYEEIRDLSDNGMIKERYFFPINGTDLVWEVDVFSDDNGEFIEWVKIDLEVPHRLAKLPELPIEGTEVILAQKGERTEEEINLIDKLYSEHFIISPKKKIN